jgi:Zn-dependent protease
MIFYIVLQLAVLILAITVHEYAHGYTAYRLGDPTAKYAGRLTLNPLAHIDPFGTIILPFLLVMMGIPPIGWAKPMPVDFMSLRNPRRDALWVGIAGCLANFTLAFLSALVIKLLPAVSSGLFGRLLIASVVINVILGVFNLIPIPPLDGSRIVSSLLPYRCCAFYNKLAPYGFWLILILVWSGALRKIINIIVLVVIRYVSVPITFF